MNSVARWYHVTCGPEKSIQITVERPTRVPSPAARNKSNTLSTNWKKVTSNFPDTFRPQHRSRTSERPAAPLLHEVAHRTRTRPRSPRQGATTAGWNPTSFQVARGDTPSNMERPRISRLTSRQLHTALSAAKRPRTPRGGGTFCAEYCCHFPSVSAFPCANSTDGSLFFDGANAEEDTICSKMSHSGTREAEDEHAERGTSAEHRDPRISDGVLQTAPGVWSRQGPWI